MLALELRDLIFNLAVAALFVFLGGAAIKLRLDVAKTIAAVGIASVVVLVFWAVAEEKLWEWVAEVLVNSDLTGKGFLVVILGMFLVYLVVWLVSLAVCLSAIGDVPGQAAFGLSLFSTGASIASVGIYLMFLVRDTSAVVPSALSPVYLTIGIGLILAFIGYAVGASATRDFAADPGDGGSHEARPSGNQFHIDPITPAEPSFFSDPLTGSRQETVAPSSKSKSVALAWIVVSKGPSKGDRLDLAEGNNKVGRSKSCRVCVHGDDEVSREHCVIKGSKSSFQLCDLAAKNGTFLNGSRVYEPRMLQDGDEIKVGNTLLVFKSVG